MKISFKILASFTGHTLYLVGSVVFAIVFLPLVIFCKFIGNYKIPSSLIHQSLSFFVTKVLTWLGVMKIEEVKGLERLSSLGPAVYVCNHRGKLDGPLVLSYVNYLKPTMKSKYARRPVFRVFVRWFDFCEIDIQSTSSLVETDKKCSKLLQQQSILFFPEGTRRSGDRISDFKKMAFTVAVNNNVPVVPVLLFNDVPFMTKNLSSFFPLEKVKFKIHFLEPMYHCGKSANELKNDVYDIMNKGLREMSKI